MERDLIFIVDDGGDATLLIHKGYEAEDDSSVLNVKASSHEEAVIYADFERNSK